MASPDLDLSIKLESSTEELKSSSPSLEILKPESWVPPSSISAPTETSRHLEDLTRQVIEVFCNQDWDNTVLKKHAIANFQGIIEYCSARTQTLEEHIELHKKIHKANPGYIFDVRSCDVDVDEEKGQATAWAVLTKPCDQCVKQHREHDCQYPDGLPIRNDSSSQPQTESSTSAESQLDPTRAHIDSPSSISTALSQTQRSADLVHVWTAEFPTRGRSHYSFYLEPFKPLLAFALDNAPATQSPDPLRSAESGAYDGQEISVNPGRSHERHAQHIQGQASANIYDELPSKETAGFLFERYFDTFNKVCPILYRPTFETAFNAMFENPRSVKICFVMETLMVLALGNATLPLDQQAITQDVALGWLDLAASAPSTAMDLREFDIDTVRMWALINYTRQLLKFDPVADYIFTGSALRAGMVIGLHRPSAWAKGGNRRGLWEALVGLDLQACLASGSPPSLPWLHFETQLPASEAANLGDDDSTTRHLHDIRLGRALSRSLSVRYKIAHLVNVETHASFDTAIALGRELTRIMAPAVSSESGNDKSFQHRFVNGIYRSFLAAVHRPFAYLDLAAYHYSRDLSIVLATQHLEDVIAALQPRNTPDHFDRLLSGYGAFFKLETYHAVLILSYHIYHKSEEQLALEAAGITSSADQENMVEVIRRYLEAVQNNDTSQDLVPQPHLIASLALSHFHAAKSVEMNSAGYKSHMSYEGRRAMRGELLPDQHITPS